MLKKMRKEVSMLIVSKYDESDYSTIQEAVDNAKEGDTILIKEGVYKERVTVKTKGLTILGSNSDFRASKAGSSHDASGVNHYLESDRTILTFGLYARMPSEDIGKLGTFRSYTMFIDASDVTVKNLTIENSAGAGPEIGQAIALYAEGNDLHFENVRLLGWQDTLFTGPLPDKEIEKNGFCGPKQFAPRINGIQYYKNCYIEGDIDFIFGSATAYFLNCLIFQKDRAKLFERIYRSKTAGAFESIQSRDEAREVKSYATAASTPEGQELGYVFNHCSFESDCPDNSCYLGRPWRNHAAVCIMNSYLGPHIRKEGFHNWNKKDAESSVRFLEYENFGPGAISKKTSEQIAPDSFHEKTTGKRASFVKTLSREEAAHYLF